MPPESDDMRELVMEQGTGYTYVRIDGEQYTLKPPLLGHLRELELVSEQVLTNESAEAERERENGDGTVTPLPQSDRDRLVLPWWRLLFELREKDGKPLPDDDMCPPWMGNGLIVMAQCLFWQRYPLGDPGRGPGIPADLEKLIVQSLLQQTTALATSS